jgi:putative transposase
MRQEVGLSERRACGLLGLRRSTYRYAPRAPGALELRTRLRREGWRVNHKHVYRLYRLEGLGLRRKRPKRAAGVRVMPLVPPRRANERWAMDFMTDALRWAPISIVGRAG